MASSRSWPVGHHLPGDAADFGEGLPQVQAPPGWREVDFLPLVLEDVGPQDLPGQGTEQLLGEGHEVLVSGVGLVKLQHGEFGVVEGGEAFVSEVAVDLVHPLEAAHYQALQVSSGAMRRYNSMSRAL